ncbi:MAG: hypothetical protein DHS20C14_18930 [Phycisphaeraceae bacterium]|nr:MAG: hypothetical protein DHS20C14_18930 [Phycisphaeraceae bacterium]
MVNKNNVMAGMFLVGGLLLAVAMSFWLGEAASLFGSKTTYIARFDLKTGTAGLQPGSDVTLAGQSIGRVVEVRTVYEEGPDGARVPAAIDVEMVIDAEVTLYEDAYAELASPLLGGVSAINFGSVGSGPFDGSPELGGIFAGSPDPGGILDQGETLRGRLAPGILALAGLDAEAIASLKQTFLNVESASKRVDTIVAAFETEAEPSAKSVHAIITDIEGFTANFNEPGGWSDDVDSVLGDGRAFASQLMPAAERMNQLVGETGLAVADARAVLNDNRDRLSRTMINVEAISDTVRYDSVDRVHELLDQGVLAASSYGDLGDQLNVIVDHEYPKVRGALSDVADITEQGSMFVSELRAQPWRVLAQPSGEDLEREPLYTAARSYARAVADLRAAGEALESVVTRTRADGTPRVPNGLDVVRITALRDDVDAAFDRYKQAEQSLLNQMIEGR